MSQWAFDSGTTSTGAMPQVVQMDPSLSLISAHIQFLDTQLALIHIPLNIYHSFLQPILRLLLPLDSMQEDDNSTMEHATDVRSRRPWEYEHPFVNISVTPIECSVACSRSLARRLFVPARDALEPSVRQQVSITSEDFVVMQVDGEGLNASQRVLDLTSPLAMARISIFFITTYFSDYILVPLQSRGIVIQALEERGFAFEQQAEAYINAKHHRNISTASFESLQQSDFSTPGRSPATPPPATLSELQTRTFATLKRHRVSPMVDPAIQLIQCAGRKDNSERNGSSSGSFSSGRMMPPSISSHAAARAAAAEDTLYLGLVKCLITPPQFLSLTLTDTEPASLLLERSLLGHFQNGRGDSVLLGSKEDILIPIILDLSALPMESTGIVCGVAGRLVGDVGKGMMAGPDGPVEMSYLSTAKAGAVIVAEEYLERALEALEGVGGDGDS